MTKAILNTGDSVSVDVAVLLAPDVADYALIDANVQDAQREAIYQKITGLEDFPLSVRVGHYVNAKANDGIGQTNISIKISSFVQETIDGETISTLPCTATLALSMPGLSGIPDKADVTELIGNLYAWMLPISSGVVDDATLDELKFGVVGNLLAHGNTPSS